MKKRLLVLAVIAPLVFGGVALAETNHNNDVKKCYSYKGDERVEVECECPKITLGEDKDKCVDVDVCLNLEGDNETVPAGYVLGKDGCTPIPKCEDNVDLLSTDKGCLPDVCRNLGEDIEAVPVGDQVVDGVCSVIPPVVTPPTPPVTPTPVTPTPVSVAPAGFQGK